MRKRKREKTGNRNEREKVREKETIESWNHLE